MRSTIFWKFILVGCLLLNAPFIHASGSSRAVGYGAGKSICFTANQGQWDDQAKFRAAVGKATIWLASDGIYFRFLRDQSPSGMTTHVAESRLPGAIETLTIKASFIGANAHATISGIDALAYKCNYFIGNDPDQWQTDVPNYRAVLYEQIYDGIDLKYYSNNGQVEYDFVVAPGTDISQIKIRYEGALSIARSAAGQLKIETDWGEIIEELPLIYQIENGLQTKIAGDFVLEDANTFGFVLENYDPSLPLIIDPTLEYSTYYGGTGGDEALALAVDASGATYLTGRTVSEDFPLSPGAPDTDRTGTNYDAFVSKLNADGDGMVYSTYLGGAGLENYVVYCGIAVNASGEAYVVGQTFSTDFPTVNAIQGQNNGVTNAFITKLNSAGNGLIYSTYLGGNGEDFGNDIAVDKDGAAYITGEARTGDFPTSNAYQDKRQGGYDAFLTKISSSGDSLLYSTYLGGDGYEKGYGIAVDSAGSAFVTGFTTSKNFPTTAGTFQEEAPGFYDAFVVKFNPAGDSLLYCTYLGGAGDMSEGRAIVVDASGAAYISGITRAMDFPTKDPIQTKPNAYSDVFVTKLSNSGTDLIYSTILGGNEPDRLEGMAIDASGAAYVVGMTYSEDFPTLDPIQGDFSGAYDGYVAKLNSAGNGLIFSTYLGGDASDYAYGVAVDAAGAAYIAGQTGSANFPILNPYQGTLQGGDAFVMKFAPTPTCCAGIRGNANSDPEDKVNITDITYLVEYLFGVPGGPTTYCREEGNINGDPEEKLNITDITYLTQYLFGVPAGPAPPACP